MRRLIAMLVLAAALCCAADISGTWNLTVEIQGNTGNPKFVLKQEGEKLTGTYSGQLGEAPVTGTIQGDMVEFSFNTKSDVVSGKITYRGKVTGSKMSGKVIFAEMGEGTFEGTKT